MFSVNSQLTQLISRHLPGYSAEELSITPVSGLTGTSWQIANHHPCWLAKPLARTDAVLGINRWREYHFLKRLSAVGLAAAPLLITNQWLISGWIDGQLMDKATWISADGRSMLADSLVKLHRQPTVGFSLDLHQRFIRYWQSIDRHRITPNWLRLHQSMLRSPCPRPLKLAPTHLDLHPDNIVLTVNGPVLIDWEYAIDADIAFELAALFDGNRWDQAAETDFLQHYIRAGGYEDLETLARQVALWKPYTHYLMLMWYETRWQQTRNPLYLEASDLLRSDYAI
ncbi:phosphotransferase [Pragia fontium]|nr:phosphotransferase [Pragia fontium]